MMACTCSLIKSVVVAGAFYAVPKALTYLCTRPEDSDTSLWGRLRGRMADLQEQSRALLGERLWFYTVDIVADNAWISAIAIRCLTSTPFASVAMGISTITAFGTFCVLAWLVRHGVSRQFPLLAPVIGTRNLR